MARTLYVYTDEQGTAHAVADWNQVPANLRVRAKAVATEDAPRPAPAAAAAQAGGPLPHAAQAALALLAVVVAWKVSKSFFVRAAAVVAFVFWLYIQAFNWFNILGPSGPTPAAGENAAPAAETSSDSPN